MKPLVTFDLWETLIFDPPGKGAERRDRRIRLFQEALAELGHTRSLEALERAYRAGWERIAKAWEAHGERTVPEQICDWLELAECDLNLEPETMQTLERVYVQPFVDEPAGLLQGSVETVMAAREAGFQVGLISNTGRTPGKVLRLTMEHYGLLEHFDFTIFSDEARMRKPSPEIFHLAARNAGVDTGIHIGDHANYDITGGRSAGWKTIWVTAETDDPEGRHADLIWPDIASGAAWFQELESTRSLHSGGLKS